MQTEAVRSWIYVTCKKKAQRNGTHGNSKISNNLVQANTHGSLGLEQMACTQLSGPPETEEKHGKTTDSKVVRDNKKEEHVWRALSDN